MGLFDQVILAAYTLSLTLLSGIIVLASLGWREPINTLAASLLTPEGRWTTGVLGALFLVSSVRLLFLVFRRRTPSQALVRETELGEVQIALTAVENLVNRIGRQVDGVRDMKARVAAGTQGVRVRLRAGVTTSTAVPELSDELQRLVRQQVRQVVGVEVEHVRVDIEDIGAEPRRRRLD